MTRLETTTRDPDPDHRLVEIDAALARGDVESARRLSKDLHEQSKSGNDASLEAGALLRLACCDLARSRVERAYGGAMQAARALSAVSAQSAEVDALALCARAAAILGRTVESVETALLATKLAEELPVGLCTARAYASLGLAYGWARAFAQAEEAFETAAQVAHRQTYATARLEVIVARAWIQAIRCFDEGRRVERCSPELVAELLDSRAGADSVDSDALTPGSAATLHTSRYLIGGLLSLWAGEAEQARAALTRCAESGSSTPGWMLAAQSWLAAELAMQAGDLDTASLHATRMATLSAEVEHLPLQCLGHELAGEIHARQGRPDLALNELQLQLKCERKMRAQDLEGRADIASLRVRTRRGDAQIKELADRSTQFEQWAYEDALTGIANLRRFNQRLTEWSAASEDGGTPLCVALIDVDHFRDINNNFTYEVGNQALRGIAAEMTTHVRSTDLAARWGGDEFAILFRDTDVQTAEQVALRIQQAIRERDWSSIAEGLSVSISVGVTEAHAGDSKASIVARSEALMYAQKLARRRAELELAVAPLVVRRVATWLRSAERVVVFVGAGSAAQNNPAAQSGAPTDLEIGDPRTFGDVKALRLDPAGFASFWGQWRQSMRARKPSDTHRALVELAHRLPQVLFVTERVDGVLAMAGAEDVIELYGNAFRSRCSACGRVNPNADRGRCLPCGSAEVTLRPDIVLHGEPVDSRSLAGTEWAMKRANLILVVDSDASIYPGSSLVEKGRSRGARIVVLGKDSRTQSGVADVSLAEDATVVARLLAQALDEVRTAPDALEELSDDGFAVLCFLTGQRSDNLGMTLDQALRWKDWEVQAHQRTIPWIFPLPTRSAVNAQAPVPSRRDFEILAGDEKVRAGMRQAFLLMLRFYGFEWRDGRVTRSPGWRNGFAIWAVGDTHHDLFISRILGALSLTGLKNEAEQFLAALEPEVRQYRGAHAHQPLRHWHLALEGGPRVDEAPAFKSQ